MKYIVMARFKALVFPVKLGELAGTRVSVIAYDALSANAQFCRLTANLTIRRGQPFDFSHFEQVEDE